MAECKYCGKKGFFVSVDSKGLCPDCRVLIYPQVERTIQIVQESEKIIKESKNWKTRLGRCDTLREILSRFEEYERRGIQLFNMPLSVLLASVEQNRIDVVKDTIRAIYKDACAKSEMATTATTKVNAVNKGILKLRELNEIVDQPQLFEKAVAKLEQRAHQMQYKAFVDAAQKAEFKGNLKRALDQYQEALYFLRTDRIADSLQKSAIENLEGKIAEIQNALPSSARAPKRAAKRISNEW